MSEVKVSIIMPVYNAERYLKETLESVKRQSFKDYELIAINDGSIDSSEAILESYIDDINIRIISQENVGVSATRNRGIREACGEYICFWDSDDIWHKDCLNILYSASKENDANIVFCDYKPFYQNFIECEYDEKVEASDICGLHKTKSFDYVMGVGLGTSLGIKMFRTDLLVDNDIIFNEKSSYGEDMFFTWKAFLVSNKIYYVKKVLYGYRQNVTGITTKVHKDLFEIYLNEYEQLRLFGERNKIDGIELNQSIRANLLKVIPSFLRMNIRRKSSIFEKYQYVKYLNNHDEIQLALQECKAGENSKNKLYQVMIDKKYFQILCHGAYMEYRFRLARCIKNWRIKDGR